MSMATPNSKGADIEVLRPRPLAILYLKVAVLASATLALTGCDEGRSSSGVVNPTAVAYQPESLPTTTSADIDSETVTASVISSVGSIDDESSELSETVTETKAASPETDPQNSTATSSLTLPSIDDSGQFNLDTFQPERMHDVGERIGRIFTNDREIEAALIMTDSRENEEQWVSAPIEGPELDYVHEGAGMSRDNGYGGVAHTHAVVLAHNTTPGIDYFRNLGNVKIGSILTAVYEHADFEEIVQFEAVTNPIIMDDSVETARFIYGPKDVNYNLQSSLTTYTCDTVGGNSDERVVVIWKPISVEVRVPSE